MAPASLMKNVDLLLQKKTNNNQSQSLLEPLLLL